MTIQNNEHLARFIPTEGWFNQEHVKGDAFRPRKDYGVLKTSVVRHDDKNHAETKRLGVEWTKVKRSKPINLLGWADVTAGAVRTISTIPALDIEEDPGKKNLIHANIIGWDIELGQQWIQAEEVARCSSLNLLK